MSVTLVCLAGALFSHIQTGYYLVTAAGLVHGLIGNVHPGHETFRQWVNLICTKKSAWYPVPSQAALATLGGTPGLTMTHGLGQV